MVVLLSGLAAHAATNYEINVGGVEVTSDNAGYITGKDISSGYGVYNSSTNTLTLYNINITRSSGSGDYAVHNRNCSGLTIKFVGTCNLTTETAHTIHMDKTTHIQVTSGSTLNVKLTVANSSSTAALYSKNNSDIYLEGPGKIYVKSYGTGSNNPSAIKGEGSNPYLYFTNNISTDIYAHGYTLYNYKLFFYSGSHNLSCQSGYNVFYGIADWSFSGNEAVCNPADATISGGSLYDLGHKVTKAYISDSYGVILSSANFPNYNFRYYLRDLYNSDYLTQSELQNLTTLNVNGYNIYDLKGIEKLIYLQNLDCGSNQLTSLNVQTLNNLKQLNCERNSLTSLTLPPTSSSALQTIECGENKFTTLSFSNYPKLAYVDVSNNPNLTSFYCCSNSKLFGISVTNCSALNRLECYDNSYSGFTYLNLKGNSALTYLNCGACPSLNTIDNLSSCTEMQTLYCQNTNLSDLSAVNNLNKLQQLDCHNTKISSLTLTNKSQLNYVSCYNCPQLTTANISSNSALTTLQINNCSALTNLRCYNNALTTLNVTSNTALNELRCWSNQLTTFSLSGCTALNYLDCSPSYSLSSISYLSNCTAMKFLDCSSTAITDLSAVNNMSNLETLKCDNTKISSLTVTNKSKLATLYCNNNPSMTSLIITGNSVLTSFSVSGNTALNNMNASNNANLSNITNLSACTNLTSLNCRDCKLSSLDVSALTKLNTLICCGNNLTTLNVSNKTNLVTLWCGGNPMTSLTVQGCSKMTEIDCSNSRLTSLNLQGCTVLKRIYCNQNQITGSGMTTLVNSLPTRSSTDKGSLYAIYNSNEGNTMTTAQINSAKNKYWTPLRWNGSNWVEYTGTIRGDVNGDGNLSIADLTELIELLLQGNTAGNTAADVDGSGNVSIADVTALIDILLSVS